MDKAKRQGTTKTKVNLDKYRKRPRKLKADLLEQLKSGALQPVLDAVRDDETLELHIRDGRFNVYYGGGNLMQVDGRSKRELKLNFDGKYFKGHKNNAPTLPEIYSQPSDIQQWVRHIPTLKEGMNNWWSGHKKGERMHCQWMATHNLTASGPQATDYLVLDLEYQWAQRRLDLMAAKRNPTDGDPNGWRNPNLTFVEVKSEFGACSGSSGLRDHASDFHDICKAQDGDCQEQIKKEYSGVIGQRRHLGLFNDEFDFEKFSDKPSELLVAFVDMDVSHQKLDGPLAEMQAREPKLGSSGSMRFMSLDSTDYLMTAERSVGLTEFMAKRAPSA